MGPSGAAGVGVAKAPGSPAATLPVAAGAAKPVGSAPAPAGAGTKPGTTAPAVGLKPAVAAGPAVRTVVEVDSASTALAIAALVASLISFGVVLMSFLQK
ncbi:MAG: hypothetical protein EB090_01850 [Verrucomicrobia bacterium]|nr:hypothetical protein [Verrucomicrobiota bacterium]